MSSWNEDRKFVLESLRQNADAHKDLGAKIDRLAEGHWKLTAKVAGLAAVIGLLSGFVSHFAVH